MQITTLNLIGLESNTVIIDLQNKPVLGVNIHYAAGLLKQGKEYGNKQARASQAHLLQVARNHDIRNTRTKCKNMGQSAGTPGGNP